MSNTPVGSADDQDSEDDARNSMGPKGEHEPSGDSLSADLLTAALHAARHRAADLSHQIEVLSSQREKADREIQLLEQLVALRLGPDAPPSRPAPHVAEGTARRSPTPAGAHPAVLHTITELEEAGKPLHISELMRLLNEDDVEIPGAGAQANLIAHLMRSSEIVRPSRGMYALRVWDLHTSAPVKKSVRKRMKGTARGRK